MSEQKKTAEPSTVSEPQPACCDSTLLDRCCSAEAKPTCCGPQTAAPATCSCR
jgi:hypothetical protein